MQHFFTRLSLVLVFMGWLWICKTFDLLSFSSPQCIRDQFFTMTQPVNLYLQQHRTLLDFFIIVTSWSIDLLLLVFAFLFVFYYRSWRFVIWGCSFYPVRSILQVGEISNQIIQLFFGMKIPDSYIWHYPGFPSIFVPYSKGDFFYSGHVGLVLAISLELFNYKINWLAIIALVFNLFNTFVLVVTRSHYSVDIFGGLIISHYFYILAGWLSNYLDQKGFIWQRKILSEKQRNQQERIQQFGYRRPLQQLRHATGGFYSEDQEGGYLINNRRSEDPSSSNSNNHARNVENNQKLQGTSHDERNQKINNSLIQIQGSGGGTDESLMVSSMQTSLIQKD